MLKMFFLKNKKQYSIYIYFCSKKKSSLIRHLFKDQFVRSRSLLDNEKPSQNPGAISRYLSFCKKWPARYMSGALIAKSEKAAPC